MKTNIISERGIESVSSGSSTQSVKLSDFSIVETATDGYKTNGWVRRSIDIIAAQASAPPWVVENKDGEIIDNHPLAIAFESPHPQMTRTLFMKTIVKWIELVGTAPVRVFREGSQYRFGLVNPNRIQGVIPAQGDLIYAGFEVDLLGSGTFQASADYSLETMVIPRYADPINLGKGVGTLLSAALAVDQDNEQSEWNVSLMQNKGRVEDVFLSDQPLDKTQGDSLTQRIWEKIRGKGGRKIGKPLVLSHGMKYQRMGLTPQEVDFINSRKFNREEIAGIFGVPVQLLGSEAASTFSNFSAAMRVLWEGKVFDVLNTVRDELNLFFLTNNMLAEGERFTYDTSKITALRDDEKVKADTAKTYYEMGVPVDQVNDRLSLGFDKYEGSDKPFNGLKSPVTVTEQRYFKLKEIHERQIEVESLTIERTSEMILQPFFEKMLREQEEAIFKDFDANRFDIASIERTLKSITNAEFLNELQQRDFTIAKQFSETVVVRSAPKIELRAEEDFDATLAGSLQRDANLLQELSFINEATASAIVDQVQDFIENNKSIQQLKQAIQDVGITDPIRASRIARTIGTNAASIGQFTAAQETGANTKTWNVAGFATREIHEDRNGETVPMSAHFSVQSGSIGPRWPGDAIVSADDRINCRCFLTYSIT